MLEKYTYLFPFEKIPQGSKVVIYGAGKVGQEYLQQILASQYCIPIAFLDRNHQNLPPLVIPVYAPQQVKEIAFDYIVIALQAGYFVKKVVESLVSYGVEKERIIYIPARNAYQILAYYGVRETTEDSLSYCKEGISVALKFGPGLGDAIVKKRMVAELARMAPECCIDIYAPGINEILQAIYGQEGEMINRFVDDGGMLFAQSAQKYHVAIETIFNMINIVSLQTAKIETINPAFADRMDRLQKSWNEYHINNSLVINRFVHLNRMKYLGLNYYNYLNFTGAFQIDNFKVDIPLQDSKEALCHLDEIQGDYVTVNYGSRADADSKNNAVAKQWPYAYWKNLVTLFKEKYPMIKMVQLGVRDAARIPGIDYYLLGENLEIVKHILKNSLLHIDIEGGLVHLATQLQTKCIVLFGPTQKWFFGYPQNINIQAGACHDCHFLYDGVNVCARGMKEPECMYSITPELVMEKVEEHFERIVTK